MEGMDVDAAGVIWDEEAKADNLMKNGGCRRIFSEFC